MINKDLLSLQSFLYCFGIFNFRDFIAESCKKYLNDSINLNQLSVEFLECNQTIFSELKILDDDSEFSKQIIDELEVLQLTDEAVKYRLFANVFLATIDELTKLELDFNEEISISKEEIQTVEAFC